MTAKKPTTDALAAVGKVPDARSATRRAADRRELYECMRRHPSGKRLARNDAHDKT